MDEAPRHRAQQGPSKLTWILLALTTVAIALVLVVGWKVTN